MRRVLANAGQVERGLMRIRRWMQKLGSEEPGFESTASHFLARLPSRHGGIQRCGRPACSIRRTSRRMAGHLRPDQCAPYTPGAQRRAERVLLPPGGWGDAAGEGEITYIPWMEEKYEQTFRDNH